MIIINNYLGTRSCKYYRRVLGRNIYIINDKFYYYYYYSSNLRAHGVCNYSTLPIIRQDLSSYLTTYIYKYTRPFRMVFFFTLSPLNYPITSFDQEILNIKYRI